MTITQNALSKGLLWEARTRILTWYVILTTSLIGLSIPIFSQLVIHQVHQRVQDDLIEDWKSFRTHVNQHKLEKKDDLENIFRSFLSQTIPEDDTFFITIVDHGFEGSSSRALPTPLQPNSELMNRWANLKQLEQGSQKTKNSQIGNILYLADPITINGEIRGVFVTAHTTAGEIQEATSSVIIVIQVLLIGLFLAVILSWIASGKVLSPLRSLSRTARSIGESDLTQRIPVQGRGEIAELAMTFNSMMDRLQTAFENQRAFLDDVGHELKTPITIIRGHLELWDEDPQEQQQTIDILLDELDRMNRFVNDLLLLAKSEQPNFLKLEFVDLPTLTQEIYNKAVRLAERQWKLEMPKSGWIIADRQRLTQAIINLAENATRHTQEKDTIAIGSHLAGKFIYLWVEDTGAGIALEDQQRIFKRFVRLNLGKKEGAGLGLSIVQAIARSHRGRVDLKSALGVGSRFTLVLPILPESLLDSIHNQSK